MAKRHRKTSINRRLEQGFGEGHGQDYKPWYRIQDVPSNGFVHRIYGWHTHRVHHFLSNLERDCFLVFQWAYPKICDIREQYPLLPQTDTLEIAESLGIRHPTDPKTRRPIVMTSDFNLTVSAGLVLQTVVRTVKPAVQLAKTRILEKFEIERIYWEARGINWGIITEKEIPLMLVKNLRVLENRFDLPEQLQFTNQEIQITKETLQNLFAINHTQALSKVCAEGDIRLGYRSGTCLAVAYHLIARRIWQVNLQEVPLNPNTPLHLEL